MTQNKNKRKNNTNNTKKTQQTKSKNRKIKHERLIKKRIVFLIFIFIFALVFVGIIRVFFIKAENGDEFEKNAIENQINKVQDTTVIANRGSILDRNNQALAISSTVYNVALDIRMLSEFSQDEVDKIFTKLSKLLNIEKSQLDSYLKKDAKGNLLPENDTHWKIIKKKIPYDLGKKIQEEKLKGVNLETDTKRSYPQKNTAAQTIGFIRGDTMWGLEATYNDELTGTPGRIYRTYENNSSIVTNDIEPINGNNIVTTLDLTLQQYAQEVIKKAYNDLSPTYTPETISLILMNPKTGEILTMAQYPDFDLNDPNNISLLENKAYKEKFDKMTQEEQLKIENSIWKNFAITDAFEPGSTFKAITVAAALEEGVINKNDTFYCAGYKQVADYKIRCHKRDGHGTLTLTEALEKSCNMAMLEIAEKLKRNSFYKYQRDFGFGYKTGIDLTGEISANNYILPIEKLNITELATSAFGQTFTATPIQIINSFAATINGGNLLKPYLVSQITDENGNIVKENSPEIVRKVISEDTSSFLREAMVQTLEKGGTGYKAHINGYRIGGKTATAQQGDRSKEIYTLGFAAYLPADDPEYLALITISKPKDYYKSPPGVVSPVPIMKEFLEKLIAYKAIPPSDDSKVEEKTNNSEKIILKDYTNKSLKSVIKELNSSNIDFQIVGGGGDTVVKQIPPANTGLDKNGSILLYVETKNSKTQLVPVPDTKNLTVDQATNLLKEQGFEVSVSEKAPTQKELEMLEQNIILKDNNDKDIKTNNDIIEKVDEQGKENDKSTKKVFEQIPESGVFIEKGSLIKIKIK